MDCTVESTAAVCTQVLSDTGELVPELLLRKNEIRSFRLNVKYGAEYGASFDQKYGKCCIILFQIQGRSRIIFDSEV